ncbi:MAG: DUF2812 domain-containing protein [Lachnospiraceae bacterium]|nr:DUF2812 domain-containing protein [Lachnospiraceae bacterium]
MYKFRLYYDKDAETEWLNELAARGWAMKRFFAGLYYFDKSEPGEYIYQVDFGDKFGGVSDEYRNFMQEMGVEIVQNWGYWIILRKKAADGAFELYTDAQSAMEHYLKIRKMFKVVTILMLLCFFFELFAGVTGVWIGYVAAIFIGLMLLMMVNTVLQLNNTIAELEEQQTGIASKMRNRSVSPLLSVGLLMNVAALCIRESVSAPIHRAVQLLAIVTMVVGLYLTARGKSKNK